MKYFVNEICFCGLYLLGWITYYDEISLFPYIKELGKNIKPGQKIKELGYIRALIKDEMKHHVPSWMNSKYRI